VRVLKQAGLATLVLAGLCTWSPTAARTPQAAVWRTYVDPRARFTFEYPAAFGEPRPGTDDGFAGRTAVWFPMLGADAVLTRGPIEIDRQALGGLYDEIALQILPAAEEAELRRRRAPVTAADFCTLLGASDHTSAMTGLSDPLRLGARSVDALQNGDPHLNVCAAEGRTIRFDKDADAGGRRRHVFGAIRFLDGTYSSFQIVGTSEGAPEASTLAAMQRLVESLMLS
jgi:hypothetical protein